MKHRLPTVLLLLALFAGAWLWSRSSRRQVAETGLLNERVAGSTATVNASSARSAAGTSEVIFDEDPVAPPPAGPVFPQPKPVALAAGEEASSAWGSMEEGSGVAPVTVMENIRSAFRQYSSRFAGNPVGDNQEITAALNGRNPRQMVLLNPEDGARMNERGELVDNWNSPYFFHQLSRTEMEIRSAGPDCRMWTADDLVMK